MSKQLTQTQLDEFKEVFDLFDADGNGSLSKDELANVMHSLGMNPTNEDLEAIFIKTDTDLNNAIDFTEFLQWITNKVDITSKEDLRDIFQLIDSDGNGVLSHDELRELLNALRIDLSDDEITQLIQQADLDGNGVIDYNEFVQSEGLWTKIKLTVGVTHSFKEILKQYTQLAENPSAGFGTTMPLPYGKVNAKKMGYDVSQFPAQVWESSCMCGNSFSFGSVSKGETVIDLGCGAGADLCVAASLVGETGKVIGVDMTTAMVKKAEKNAALCGFSNIELIKAPFDTAKHKDIPIEVADVVIANGSFNLSPRKKCAFVQAFNCLKPGGRFYLIDVIREGSIESEAKKGSWCDCVTGAVPISKILELMKAVGFVECKHIGFPNYRLSDYAIAATFLAKKSG
ncbi:EF-hand domain-containing protein [Thiotrichales bacterium HSG14]|nr:EF-hand domain-containing protein [Thiotrichales bacterium HSG14]